MTTLAPPADFGTTIRDRATDLRHNWRQHIPLTLLLVGTAVFYLWDITRNQMGNTFYAGAAWAGSENWKALLFGSVDPSNFITVDKPPVSQWVMGLSGQIFGFSSASMLIPEAIMGVLSVWLLYSAVHRLTDNRGASLLAGLALAITPVAAMMFRFNNPDAVMVLLMTAAAYCAVRATLAGSAKWLALAGAAMGFAFLAKMLEGLMSLPALALVYLIAAPVVVWHKRILHLLYAGIAMIAASGWYVVLTLLWPKDSRPYMAGSTDNNFMNLVLGYNGLDRIQGKSHGPGGGFNLKDLPATIDVNGQTVSRDQIQHAFHGGGMGGASAGLFRLFKGEFAVEISWLIPAAIVAFIAIIVLRWGKPRTDAIRAGGILFFCWMLVDGIVLSYMQGMIHPYYTLAIAPGIAGTVGIGVAAAWAERNRLIGRGFLAAMVVAAGIWGFVVADRAPHWNGWLPWVVLALTVIAAAAIVGTLALAGRTPRSVGLAVVGVAVIAALAAPAVYAANAVGTKQTGGNPSANPVSSSHGFMGGGNHRGGGGFGFGGSTQANPQLSALLKSAGGYRWPAATSRSSSAAGYELAYRVPVMAIGGFNDDPTPTLAQFQQYVKDHDVRYYLQQSQSGFGGGATTGATGSGANASAANGATAGSGTHHGRRSEGAATGQQQTGQQQTGGFGRQTGVTADIQQWVDANFHSQTIGGVTVYDLQSPIS